jgi:hypothetical protein
MFVCRRRRNSLKLLVWFLFQHPQAFTPATLPAPIKLSQVWVRFLLAIVGLTLAFAAALFSTIARGGEPLGNDHSRVGGIAARHLRRPHHRALPGASRRCQPCPRGDGLRRHARRPDLHPDQRRHRNRRHQHRQQFALCCRRRAALRHPGFRHRLGAGASQSHSRCSLARTRFCRRPMLARLLLRNTSSWLPSFSVRVVPAKRKNKDRWRWEAYTFGWPRNRAPQDQWFRLPDRRCAACTKKRKTHPARIRLFPFSRACTGTPRRPGTQLSSPRPLLRKKLRSGHALSLFHS